MCFIFGPSLRYIACGFFVLRCFPSVAGKKPFHTSENSMIIALHFLNSRGMKLAAH